MADSEGFRRRRGLECEEVSAADRLHYPPHLGAGEGRNRRSDSRLSRRCCFAQPSR